MTEQISINKLYGKKLTTTDTKLHKIYLNNAFIYNANCCGSTFLKSRVHVCHSAGMHLDRSEHE